MFSFIKKLDGRSRTLLYACFFAFFCNGALTLTMGSAIPDLKATYGLNDTISGLFLSAHSAGNLVAGFVSGLVPLYLGQRRSIMLLSALAYVPVSAALTFCYEQTRSIWPPVFFHMFVNALSLAVLAG